jgi:hypothetical protein
LHPQTPIRIRLYRRRHNPPLLQPKSRLEKGSHAPKK